VVDEAYGKTVLYSTQLTHWLTSNLGYIEVTIMCQNQGILRREQLTHFNDNYAIHENEQ